ncbi:MAG: hypothetical protein IPM33_04685 [Phycisphaerales bacterium]|nr:hypothetical protein [Phycisphaerales bacterium]
MGLAFVIGVATFLGFLAALIRDYGGSHDAAFDAFSGIGYFAGVAGAVLAAWNRSWLGRIPLLFVGIVCVWIGLFLANEMMYRVWQSTPNPPDEAYADTAPLGALVFGWLPSTIVVGVVYGCASLAFWGSRRWLRRRVAR